MIANSELGGLIGNWSPGIGDPTLAGWATVGLYFVAAWLCFRVVPMKVHLRVPLGRWEESLWRGLGVALLLLGINKQLDLQSALTELGRLLAHEHGWYQVRHQMQVAFVAALTMAAAGMALLVWLLARGAPHATRVALVGFVLLLGFVVVRAASFHHVDVLIGLEWAGVRLNWLLEMGGVGVVALGAWQRGRVARRRG